MPDRDTPWRQLGSTTRDGWKSWLRKRGSPMLEQADATYDACQGHHKLIAGMLWAESQAAKDMTTNPYSSMNPLNHRNVDNPVWYFGGKPGPAYMTYPDWATNIRATLKRLGDPAYKNGVYVGKDSLIQMIGTYAPSSDGNDPTNYVDTILLIANELPNGPSTPAPTPTTKDPIDVMWGGYNWSMAQDFGDTPFARSTDLYAFGKDLCLNGHEHTGEDWRAPAGTPMFNPFADGTATVIVAGGTKYYTYYQNDYAKGEGELKVKFADGSEFIFGHQKRISVKVGDKLTFGQPIGQSGGEGGTIGTADHCHGEARLMKNGRLCCVAPRPFILARAPKMTPKPVPTPDKPGIVIPGLPGGPLVTDYPIRIRLIPPGSNRSGQKASQPRRSIQHGTGNPSNASAWNEAGYFVAGAEGRGVSVHACIDHTEVVVTLPLDEQGVHAGDAYGNAHGYASEMVEATSTWNDPVKRDRVIAIAADFMGRVGARLNVEKPNKHSDYGNPSCPAKLQTVTIAGTPAWNVYAFRWQAARANELKRMKGGEPPKPVPPSPPKPPAPKPPPPPKPPKPEPPVEEDDSGWTHER